jgi:alpha,alpha-trehalose phosphorylase
MGGTWMAAVYGLAGLRDYNGELRFDPRPTFRKLRFALLVRGRRLCVDIAEGQATYLLARGPGLSIWHREEKLDLEEGLPMTRAASLNEPAPQPVEA